MSNENYVSHFSSDYDNLYSRKYEEPIPPTPPIEPSVVVSVNVNKKLADIQGKPLHIGADDEVK